MLSEFDKLVLQQADRGRTVTVTGRPAHYFYLVCLSQVFDLPAGKREFEISRAVAQKEIEQARFDILHAVLSDMVQRFDAKVAEELCDVP